MKGTKILISGGSGDLGQAISPLLISLGAEISSIDPQPGKVAGVTSIQGSILDRNLLSAVVPGNDLLIHIAAWHGFHQFTGSKNNDEFWDLNMTGTFNLLEACAGNNVKKFLFISSTSIDEWPQMYGVTKLLGEELCRAYSARNDMAILSLRPRAFIPWWNQTVYSSFLDWANWFAKGAVHINDVADAVVLASKLLLRTASAYFDTIELDGKHDFAPSELREWELRGPERVLDRRFKEYKSVKAKFGFIPLEPPTYKDIDKAKRILEYTPKYGYGELLCELRQQDRATASRKKPD